MHWSQFTTTTQLPQQQHTTAPPPMNHQPSIHINGGDVKRYNIDMLETHHLDHLSPALNPFLPAMNTFLDKHQPYILQRVDDDEAMATTQGVAVGGYELTASGHFREQLPCIFAYKVVSSLVPDFSRPLVSCRGEGCRGDVCTQTAKGSRAEYIDTPKQLLELTDAELRSFHTAINNVHDHCHIVGSYRVSK